MSNEKPSPLSIIDTHTFLGRSNALNIRDSTKYFERSEFGQTGFLTIPFAAADNVSTLARVQKDEKFLGMYLMANPNEASTLFTGADRPAAIEMLAGEEYVVGIKSHPSLFKIPMDDPRYFPIYQIAQKYDLPVLLHAAGSGQDFNSIAMTKDVLKRFRNIRIILAHGGGLNPAYMREAVNFALSEERILLNTTCLHQIGESRRVSPDTLERTITIASNRDEMKEEVMQAFYTLCDQRADGILYGSDLGWVTPDEVDFWPIPEVGTDDNLRKKILIENPKSVFGGKMKEAVYVA